MPTSYSEVWYSRKKNYAFILPDLFYLCFRITKQPWLTTEKFHVINAARIKKLEHHNFTAPNKIIDSNTTASECYRKCRGSQRAASPPASQHQLDMSEKYIHSWAFPTPTVSETPDVGPSNLLQQAR